ncbi:MAG: ferritin-like domain-containing protein [Opitutales bacterium]|nr:ferritin-like domain-containing protein [Opitutales bacterium]
MTTTIHTPRDLFFDQLREIHSMEVQLCQSMPDLVALCTNESLRELLENHIRQIGIQIAEIAAIFERHGQSPGGDTCKVIAGLIERGTTHLEAVEVPHTRDLIVIAHCLRIEHYEMAAYEITTRLAGGLGMMREPAILGELHAEEKAMAFLLLKWDSPAATKVISPIQ